MLKRVCDEMPADVRDVNPDIPDWLAEIIDKLHAKRPRDRFQSADEVARLLSRHLRHLRSPEKFEKPGPLDHPPTTVSRVWWVALLAVPAATIVGLLTWGAVHLLVHEPTTEVTSPPQGDAPQIKAPPGPAAKGPVPKREVPKREVPRIEGDAYFQTVWADLHDDNHFTLKAALERLAKMKPTDQRAKVAEKLVPLTDNESTFIRRAAVTALGVWGSENDLPALIRAAVHKDTSTRSAALAVISRFRNAQTLEVVIQSFRERATRTDAGNALREMGPMAEAAVLTLLDDKDDVFLKRDAIELLADIGTEASVPALQKALASRNVHDTHLMEPAKKALAAIAQRKKQ